VRQGLLKANDVLAQELREEFAAAGVYVVNVVSGPGAGKTELLARTLNMLLSRGRNVAAIVGDLATEHDARRLEASGARARQIITGTVCHLEASMVRKALEGWELAGIDYLFIENVGNLVCPASFDLGEDLRVLLFPVTEGEDKPLKYPTLINTADVTLISKVDLAEAVQFDRALARGNLDLARPGAVVLEVSARTGSGLEAWLELLETRRASTESLRCSARPART
jgi:hydrogenase nickel incorporation protein HypB